MTANPASAPSTPAVKKVALVSLSGDREFRKVRQHGQVIRHKYFQLRVTDYRPRYGEVWQPRAIIGIVVPKKTLKHAVDRNRVRRRVHEALRTLPELVPCRAILSPAALVLHAPFGELQVALARALGSFEPKRARAGGSTSGKAAGRAQGGGRPALAGREEAAGGNSAPPGSVPGRVNELPSADPATPDAAKDRPGRVRVRVPGATPGREP